MPGCQGLAALVSIEHCCLDSPQRDSPNRDTLSPNPLPLPLRRSKNLQQAFSDPVPVPSLCEMPSGPRVLFMLNWLRSLASSSETCWLSKQLLTLRAHLVRRCWIFLYQMSRVGNLKWLRKCQREDAHRSSCFPGLCLRMLAHRSSLEKLAHYGDLPCLAPSFPS